MGDRRVPLMNPNHEPNESQESDSVSHAGKKTQTSQAYRSLVKNWFWEITSCLTSLVTIVGIIILLRHYNGLPMPDWPYGVTLNAVLSILSTLMKATIVYAVSESLSQLKWPWFRNGNRLSDIGLIDSASRGTVGALRFICNRLPRHIITFGCMILVLTVATDPFIQQVVTIKDQLVTTSEPASINVCDTNAYDDYDAGSGPGGQTLPLRSLGAVYSGLFQYQGENRKSSLMACSSGNCTFEPYQSLEICSECANITDLLNGGGVSLSESDQSVSYYNYTLPNGISWNSTNAIFMQGTANYPLLRLNGNEKVVIANFTAMTSTPESVDGEALNPYLNATECMLYFCIKTYEAASVRRGNFIEDGYTTPSTTNYSLWFTSDNLDSNIGMTPSTCYLNGTRFEAPYKNNDCLYTLRPWSVLAGKNSISKLLEGIGQANNRYRWDFSTGTVEAIYGKQGSLFDISSAFLSLASAMSINARENVCQTIFNGTSWTSQSYVHVRWAWLTLPAALLIFSTAFLIYTIYGTTDQYIWKSSPLALIFLELSAPEGSEFSIKPGPGLGDMEDAARKLKVWLEATSEGIKFFPQPPGQAIMVKSQESQIKSGGA